MEFSYYMPTRIVCGPDCIRENSDTLQGLGMNAFIMTGAGSAQKNGSLRDVVDALEHEGIEWKHYSKVSPNPTLEQVRDAAEQAYTWGADCVIAIGGGSPMDAAKAVAVLAGEPVPDDELLSAASFPKVLPLVAVPTTAGTGSEVTPYSILTNDSAQTKSLLRGDQIYPRIAFLDGRYTMELPRHITIATAVDALSHALEGYLAVRSLPLGRTLALESLRIIGRFLPVLRRGDMLSAGHREELLYASTLAGIVISQSGTTAVHAMGYSLTYFKSVDHGVANGYLMAEYLRYLEPHRCDDVRRLLDALGMSSIDEFDQCLKSLVSTTVLTEEEIRRFAAIASKAGNIRNTSPAPTEEELKTMLTNCFAK